MLKTLTSLLTITCLATPFSAASMELNLEELFGHANQGKDIPLHTIFTQTMPNGSLIFTKSMQQSIVHKTENGLIEFSYAVDHGSAQEARSKSRKTGDALPSFRAARPTLAVDSETDEVIDRFFNEFGETKGIRTLDEASKQVSLAKHITKAWQKDKPFQKNIEAALQIAGLPNLETPAHVIAVLLKKEADHYDTHQKLMKFLHAIDQPFTLTFDLPNSTSTLTLTIQSAQTPAPQANRLPNTFDDYTEALTNWMDSTLLQAFKAQAQALDLASGNRLTH